MDGETLGTDVSHVHECTFAGLYGIKAGIKFLLSEKTPLSRLRKSGELVEKIYEEERASGFSYRINRLGGIIHIYIFFPPLNKARQLSRPEIPLRMQFTKSYTRN